MLPAGKGYMVRVRDQVINISHRSVPPKNRNLLDRVLPVFSIPQSQHPFTVVMASNYLRGDLDRQLHPPRPCPHSRPCGVVGNMPVGRLENQIGPLKLRNVTVRKVLNRLVSEHNNSAWLVVVPPWQLARTPPRTLSLNVNDLWQILEYDVRPLRWSDSVLATLRETWPRPSAQ
jgi:hypothetical protein